MKILPGLPALGKFGKSSLVCGRLTRVLEDLATRFCLCHTSRVRVISDPIDKGGEGPSSSSSMLDVLSSALHAITFLL